jgi:hypothetical protein
MRLDIDEDRRCPDVQDRLTVATKVSEGTRTSSPAPMPSALRLR